MAPATLDNHILVLLKNNIALVEEVEYGNRRQLRRRAAWFRHLARIHQVHEGLHDRVVRRVHMSVEGEIALAATIVSVVAVGRDDPVVPLEFAERHVQGLYLAGPRVVLELGIGIRIAAVIEAADLGLLLALAGVGIALAALQPRALLQARALEEGDHEGLPLGAAFEAHDADVLGLHLVHVAIGRVHGEVKSSVSLGIRHPVLQSLANVESEPALAATARVHRADVLELALAVLEPQHSVRAERERATVLARLDALEAPVESELRVDDVLVLRHLRHVEPEPLAALVSHAGHVMVMRGEGHYHVARVYRSQILAGEVELRVRRLVLLLLLVEGVLVDVDEELGRGSLHLGRAPAAGGAAGFVHRRPIGQSEEVQNFLLDGALVVPGDHVVHRLVEAVVDVQAAHALGEAVAEERQTVQKQQRLEQLPPGGRHSLSLGYVLCACES